MGVGFNAPSCMYANRQVKLIRHFHNAHEILYICGGAVRVLVGEKEYIAGKNSLLFIGRMEEHSVEILSGNGEYLRYYMELSPEQLNKIITDPKLRSVFVSRARNFCHVFDMTPVAEKTDMLFAQMHETTNTDAPFKRELISAQLQQLIIMAYRLHSQQFPQPKTGVSEAVYRAQQYLDEHFADECSVTKLAEELFLSPYYLSHAFKEWTGYSPKQYVMLSRISGAKNLLFSTDKTITQISGECGFKDVSNFVRAFKKETGQTPEQYRKGR